MARSSRISRKEFDELVDEALSQVPAPFQKLLENIVVVVEEEPDDDDYDLTDTPDEEEILGIYRGAMMTERSFNDLPSLPAQVAIFRGPILRCTSTRAEAIREIRETVVHELGHYFGLEDDEMPF